MQITLKDIYEAREAWPRFVGLRFRPRLAYDILQYSRKVEAELTDILAVYNRMIRAAAGVGDDVASVQLDIASDQGKKFLEEWTEFLNGESQLNPSAIKRAVVVDAAESQKNNEITPYDMACVDIFFSE